MPELPDVEGFKAYFDSTGLGKEISGVSAPDARTLKDVSIQSLGRKLKGTVFAGTRRWGKYLFGEVDGNGHLVLHFGMTGNLVCYKKGSDKPRFESVVFDFKDGYRLAYLSQRKLGRISLADDVEAFAASEQLGPDAMSEKLSFEMFFNRLTEHTTSVKSALLNQSNIAGIGNIWGDEILYQAGIHPKTSIPDLDRADINKLYRIMRRVLRTGSRAIKRNRPFPQTYMVSHRNKDKVCPVCKSDLETVKISGRTSYYCPECQSK